MAEKIVEFDINYKSNNQNNILSKKTNEILEKIKNLYGFEKSRDVLYNYARYIKLRKNKQVNFGTYNILIKNNSDYTSTTALIEVIKDLLQQEHVINTSYKYLQEDEIKNKTSKKENFEINEELIVIDESLLDRSLIYSRRDIINFIDTHPEKIYILVENGNGIEGLTNAKFFDYITWTMKIEKVSKDNKIDYIQEMMKKNLINIDNESTFVDMLSEESFWKVKDELANIILECKVKNIKEINDDIIKNCLKRNYYKKDKEKINNMNALNELNNMIGMKDVKEQVEKILNYININKQRGKMPMLHMCFLGNPGTGKTTVARIIGKIFSQNQVLSNKEKFVEVQRADLIGEYVGQTAPRTKEKIDKANGGILFVDEAYSISTYIQDEAGGDYGAECIATLMKEMEDKRDSLCVILAGYTKEMNHMLKTNPGFESRIQFKINFPDYSKEELYEIFKVMAKEEKYKISSSIKRILIEYFEQEKKKENFSNARCVRNLFEKIKFEQASRVATNKNVDINLIIKEDVIGVIENCQEKVQEKRKIGFAM